MITLLYIALEAIAVLLLLHALYGKKMQWDKYSVAFILFDCGLMSVIRWCGLNQNLSFIIYVVLVVYCILEFKSNIKQVIVNMVLLVVIMMGMQLIALLLFGFIGNTINGHEDILLTTINFLILLIVVKLYYKRNLYSISLSFQQKGKVNGLILILESTLLLFLLYQYKNAQGEVQVQYILVTGILVLILVLCIHALLYKIKYQEKQAELEAYKTYSAAFSD